MKRVWGIITCIDILQLPNVPSLMTSPLMNLEMNPEAKRLRKRKRRVGKVHIPSVLKYTVIMSLFFLNRRTVHTHSFQGKQHYTRTQFMNGLSRRCMSSATNMSCWSCGLTFERTGTGLGDGSYGCGWKIQVRSVSWRPLWSIKLSKSSHFRGNTVCLHFEQLGKDQSWLSDPHSQPLSWHAYLDSGHKAPPPVPWEAEALLRAIGTCSRLTCMVTKVQEAVERVEGTEHQQGDDGQILT